MGLVFRGGKRVIVRYIERRNKNENFINYYSQNPD